jgi:hypothetical protein
MADGGTSDKPDSENRGSRSALARRESAAPIDLAVRADQGLQFQTDTLPVGHREHLGGSGVFAYCQQS